MHNESKKKGESYEFELNKFYFFELNLLTEQVLA